MMPRESVHPVVPTAETIGRTVTASRTPREAAEWQGTARYEVSRRIGEGATGVVYEAFDRQRGEAVAVKRLLQFTPAAIYGFKQEFRTLANVLHPNLVLLHELTVTENDGAFIAMELVRGTDFLSYVTKSAVSPSAGPPQKERTTDAPIAPAELESSPADLDRLRSALAQVVQAVQALHAAAKLHRDIKPSNILVTPDGRVVVLDFGLATELPRLLDATVSEQREIVGTAHYMSPEQALAEETTEASDWYGVGAILHEALTGRPPFVGSALEVITSKTMREALPPSRRVSGVPPDLDALCCELLACDPRGRPTGADILRRLEVARSARLSRAVPTVAENAQSTAFVGREPQLRALREAFEHVRSGTPTTVRVTGGSGMGKSALTQLFLDRLVDRREAIVLRGRVYERESVAFKAIDGVIDALSRYLIHLEDTGGAVDLPSDIAILARVFPVLLRVPNIGDIVSRTVLGQQVVRQRAFWALRELLTTLTTRQPLVITIDDVQWGDADSAALLVELTRPPDAPPLLLVLTHREEEPPISPFLKELHDRWPARAESRLVAVGALDAGDARRLALALLDASHETAQRTAETVANESGGSPFLIEELVRSHRSASKRDRGQTLNVLSVDQMVSQRLDLLPDAARRLTEIAAVGARPLPISVVAQAAGIESGVYEALALARTQRLARNGVRDGQEVVESIHDRFRQAVLARLEGDALREYHARLADALEAAPRVDSEAIAVHQHAAGRLERAAWHSERAAEEAAAKMAFDQAARLFRLTLETSPPAGEHARRLRTRLAQVLEWSGRGEEAGRAYLEAADGAPPLQRAELERAASVGFFSSGHIVEGAAALRRALATAGLKTPDSTFSTLFLIRVYWLLMLWSFLCGFRFREREPEAVSPEDRLRIDVLFAAAIGFGISNVVLGRCMGTRGFLMALRRGDRFQVLRAATMEMNNHAGSGKEGKLERALVGLTTRLAARDGKRFTNEEQDPEFIQGGPTARTLFLGTQLTSVYLRGEWRRAREIFDELFADMRLQDLRGGWISSRKVFGCWTLNFLGEHRELARLHTVLLAEAEELGDHHTSVQLRDGSLAIMWLAADDPDGARRNIEESMARWPSDRYLLQHWHRLYGEGEIELYLGDGAKAYARVDRDTKALSKSLLLRVQHMRVQTMFLRGRCAIASLDSEPAARSQRLREILRLARRLDKEGMIWTAPFAAILRAAVANALGNRSSAIDSLRQAIDLSREADMHGYTRAASHRLGLLLGGDEGQRLVGEAEQEMADQGVRAPARFAATLVPGQWGA
jgi:serine/threonine protein kinase